LLAASHAAVCAHLLAVCSHLQAGRLRALLASLGPARLLAQLRAAGGVKAVSEKAGLEHIQFEVGAAGMGKGEEKRDSIV